VDHLNDICLLCMCVFPFAAFKTQLVSKTLAYFSSIVSLIEILMWTVL